MANERTYLAWLRTAATVMALGVAVVSIADDVSWSTATAGGVLLAVGAAGVVFGTTRYRRVTREIEDDDYRTGIRGQGAVLASSVLIAALAAALLLILIGGR